MTGVPDAIGPVGRALSPFTIHLECSALAVRDALASVLHALQPLDLTAQETGAVEVVLAEVLNNIVEHGDPPDIDRCEIEIACAHMKDGLCIEITDGGSELPDSKVPSGCAPPIDVDVANLPEGGFGWFLIHTLTREVRYERGNGTNHLFLKLAVGTRV